MCVLYELSRDLSTHLAVSVQPEAVRGGCPLINLAQEMSPLDAGFRQRLATIFRNWQDGVAAALRDGQNHGKVRRDLEPAQAAGLLIAMVEGYGALAKNAQDAKVMEAGIRNIVEWLRSLRPPGNRKPEPEETETTFIGNAVIKARAVRAVQNKVWVMGDDSGLECEGLGQLPGIHSARYAGERASDAENMAKLLKMLQLRSTNRVALSDPTAFG